MPQPSDPLEEVRRAVAARRRADARYRVAVLSAARELEGAGVRDSAARLARAAGLTRQSMREQLARWRGVEAPRLSGGFTREPPSEPPPPVAEADDGGGAYL